MQDLISRQAAIDAFLTELTKRERTSLLHTWSTVEVKYFIAKILEQLPPAQPELIEKMAYIRGFEQGRTQGMIDSQGGKK